MIDSRVSPAAEAGERHSRFYALRRSGAPTRSEFALAVVSAVLLVLSFPDFNLWPLAWVGLVPLFIAITRRPHGMHSFLLGWITGSLFFYGSCYWATYSMIHYGGIPTVIAYLLLAPLALILGLFPAACAYALARVCTAWGTRGLIMAPFLWITLEWIRLGLTGQLWNAIGYSQAYVPPLIQAAQWGGVYAVGFLIVAINAAVSYVGLVRSWRALQTAALAFGGVVLVIIISILAATAPAAESNTPSAIIVGVQPNVAVNFARSAKETATLVDRHLALSQHALKTLSRAAEPSSNSNGSNGNENDEVAAGEHATATTAGDAPLSLSLPRVVVWPESPMNFTYTQDAQFRDLVAHFARANHTSVLFNSLEPATAAAGGWHNSAVMIDGAGRQVARYDKIRLLPFGEYVPLPRWLPGAGSISAVVGDFTPGARYPLMPLGPTADGVRTGVFICVESAFPSIARRFTADGADVLINISNDGYLGPTPVLRQHLANAIFRAVENNRPILRITNTGISARISPHGEVSDATASFEPAVRTWLVTRGGKQSFYTRYGDVFALTCAALSVLSLLSSLARGDRR